VCIAPAAPGQMAASTCALALAAQAADASSPLRQRIRSLVGARVLHQADPSPLLTTAGPTCGDDATGGGHAAAAAREHNNNTARGRGRPRQWVTFDDKLALVSQTDTPADGQASAQPAAGRQAASGAGLVGASLAPPDQEATDDVKARRESWAEGGGGWGDGAKSPARLHGQQQVLSGPPHAARQFPRGWSPYECTCGKVRTRRRWRRGGFICDRQRITCVPTRRRWTRTGHGVRVHLPTITVTTTIAIVTTIAIATTVAMTTTNAIAIAITIPIPIPIPIPVESRILRVDWKWCTSGGGGLPRR